MKPYFEIKRAFIAFLILLIQAGYAGADIRDGLVSYWPMNEGSGETAGDFFGKNPGRLSEGAGWAEGKIERGVDTNGNGYIVIEEDGRLRPAKGVSVQIWAKIRQPGSLNGLICNFQDNGSNESGFGMHTTDNGIEWAVSTGRFTMISEACPLNRWVHIVGTFDGVKSRLYMDGKLAAEKEAGGLISWKFKPVDMNLGRYHDDNEDFRVNGVLDEAALWNRTLSEDEISRLYNEGRGRAIVLVPFIYMIETENSTRVFENGADDEYRLSLACEPDAEVRISAVPQSEQIDIGSGPGRPTEIVFNRKNWKEYQTVRVKAVDDNEHESIDLRQAVIKHTVISFDKNYAELTVNPVTVYIADDDPACGDWGYYKTDLNRDCNVDILDVFVFIDKWMGQALM